MILLIIFVNFYLLNIYGRNCKVYLSMENVVLGYFFNFIWICFWRIGFLVRLSVSFSLVFFRFRWRFLFFVFSWLIWLDLASWRLLLLFSLDWMFLDFRVLCFKFCCSSFFLFFKESKFFFSFLFFVIFNLIWNFFKNYIN